MASSRLHRTLEKGANIIRSYGAVGTIGAAALAIGGSTLMSPYNKDYDLKTSIDALIAPSAARLVGNYAAFEEDHVGLSGGASRVRGEVTARFEQIRNAGHKGAVFDSLDDFVEQGYRDAKDGHVTVIDTAFYAATILHADKKLQGYAARTQAHLGTLGLDPEVSQSITAGVIGTELLSPETGGDVTARNFVRKNDLDPQVASYLSDNLRDVEFAVRSVHHARTSSEKLVETRRADATQAPSHQDPSQDATALHQEEKSRTLAPEATDTRPKARPDGLGRTERIQARIQELASTTPVARTARIQERAHAIASSKRPVAWPGKRPFETEI